MKVLLINGSPHPKGCTYRALKEITVELYQAGIEFEIENVGKDLVRGCSGCGMCKKSGDGHCVYTSDRVNEIIDKMKYSDALIVGSPVYYANVAGSMRSFLDRMFYAGDCFKNKPAAAIVNCRRGGASAAFDQLNHYFLISNMIVVGSQYRNMTHGKNPDEVEKDLEGLQTMRTLGKNMAWLLKCLKAGNENGIRYPRLEEKLRTNFISQADIEYEQY